MRGLFAVKPFSKFLMLENLMILDPGKFFLSQKTQINEFSGDSGDLCNPY